MWGNTSQYSVGRRLAGLIAAMAVAMAACGDDDGGGTVSSASTASADVSPSSSSAASPGSTGLTQPSSAAAPDITPLPESGCVLPLGEVTPENQCKFEGETLRVSASPGGLTDAYIAGVGALFEETTGAKIEWVAQTPDPMLAQLITAGDEPPTDVVLDMYMPTLIDADRAGVFQQLDWKSIPNLADLPDVAYGLEGYGPATWFNAAVICVNEEKFESAGLSLPTSWEDLFDPAVEAIGFPQPENTRWNLTMASLAAYYGATAQDPDPLFEALEELGPRLRFYSGTSDADQLVQSGEVFAVVHADGRCNGLTAAGAPVSAAPFRLEIDGKRYRYLLSTTGPQITTGTDKLELAMTFINTLFTVDGLLPVTSRLIYTPAKPSIVEAMQADPALAPFMLTDLEEMYVPDQEQFMTDRTLWLDTWNRTFQ